MSISQIMFYVLAAFILGMATLSVTTRKIFRSAIWLLFSLIGVAGLYFWLNVEFIAAVQIIVYVGGIVVLIIFSIFLTEQSGKEMPQPTRGRALAAALAVMSGFALTFLLINRYGFLPVGQDFDANVARIGTLMLRTDGQGFALPFEAVSVLLLAAMIGCIVIAIKPNKQQEHE